MSGSDSDYRLLLSSQCLTSHRGSTFTFYGQANAEMGEGEKAHVCLQQLRIRAPQNERITTVDNRPNSKGATRRNAASGSGFQIAEESLVDMEHADVVLIFNGEEKVQLFLRELTKVIPSFGVHTALTKCKVVIMFVHNWWVA
ncbi:hypothetical protein CLF_108514 [Clonorchis sinensis]|uniref:Uncharacterized protein n=1 Tax=Clonorchis sinensis TaxID=79923 RepID=G7YI67_CLOSI|nr:hypothetical protein CLF_108514 [Clonorchis sinensis]